VGVYQFQKTDKFTQELRVTSRAGRPLEWAHRGLLILMRSRRISKDSTRFGMISGNPIPNNLLTASLPSTYSELAGFLNATYHLTSRFDVSGGLRYAHNEQSVTQNGSGLLIVPFLRSGRAKVVFTYLANARYRFSRNATAYIRYATGYRPGGPNAVIKDVVTGLPLAPPTYQSDHLKSYEAGVKARTSDGTSRN